MQQIKRQIKSTNMKAHFGEKCYFYRKCARACTRTIFFSFFFFLTRSKTAFPSLGWCHTETICHRGYSQLPLPCRKLNHPPPTPPPHTPLDLGQRSCKALHPFSLPAAGPGAPIRQTAGWLRAPREDSEPTFP